MKKVIFSLLSGLFIANALLAQVLQYPKVDKVDQVDTYFGTKVSDPYRWLEDDNSEATLKFVQAENKVTEEYLSTIPFRDKIKSRLTQLWNFPKWSVPFKAGNNYFVHTNDGLQNQFVLNILRNGPGSKPEPFLDPNKLSTDGTVNVSSVSVSNDGRYLAYSSSSGGSDWQHNITDGIDQEPIKIARELGLDLEKPIIGLLTNVIWDAQISYPSNAFSDQVEWLLSSVDYFKKRKDLQLLIRVHPAELKSWIASRQFAIDEIKKAFGEIPSNIFIIPPESKLNTYQAMKNCNAVIVYGTIAGLELACMGIPIIVAGQAWVRNKKISIDVSSPENYFKIFDLSLLIFVTVAFF